MLVLIIVANSNWSCLLISAPKVHWRVQPTAARRSGRFNQMHEALRALHNLSTRTVSKCFIRNNNHLITLKIWMEWIIMSGERRMKLFWNFLGSIATQPSPSTSSDNPSKPPICLTVTNCVLFYCHMFFGHCHRTRFCDSFCLAGVFEMTVYLLTYLLHPKPKIVSELKVALEKIWNNFPQV